MSFAQPFNGVRGANPENSAALRADKTNTQTHKQTLLLNSLLHNVYFGGVLPTGGDVGAGAGVVAGAGAGTGAGAVSGAGAVAGGFDAAAAAAACAARSSTLVGSAVGRAPR